MKLSSLFMSSRSKKHHYMPLLSQQASYLKHASSALCEMMETMDPVKWRRLEKEVKACEVQGDALLSELHERLYENILKRSIRSDIQLLSMNIDEFLDNINDSAKSILLYMPQRIDPHMKDLAQYINAEAESIRKMMPYMMSIMIIVMGIFMPSGLCIYWVTSNLFTIIQNLAVKRRKKNGKA